MNGPHDMGGMQCYGPVLPQKNEPLFHGEWEKRAMALTVGMGFCGQWNIDASRFARESLSPTFYLSKTYYQIWLHGLQNLMLERGLVTENELATGKMETHPVDVKRVVSSADMPAALAAGGPVEREPSQSATLSVGDRVTTLNIHPQSHTRLPRYARGKTGIIIAVHGCHVFPDTNALGEGENPQWLYAVQFDSRTLFGPDAEMGNTVVVDCWEPYLARA